MARLDDFDDDYYGYTVGRGGGPGRRSGSGGMTCFVMTVMTGLVTLLYFRLRGESLWVSHLAELEPKSNGVENTVFRDRIAEFVMEGKNGEKFVVVTASNYAYRRLFVNFECMMQFLKVDKVVVNALDSKMHEFAFRKGYNVFNIVGRTKLSDTQLEYPFHRGTRQFNYLTMLKFMLPLKILQQGYDVIYSDLDVGFYGDFINDLYNHEEDIVSISDQNVEEKPPNSLLGTGLFLVRSNPGTIEVFYSLLKRGLRNGGRSDDQALWNDVLCAAGRVGRDTCLLSFSDGEVYVHALDRDVYSPRSEFRSSKPMAVHFNKLYGWQQKWRQLLEAKSWFIRSKGECDPHRGKVTVVMVEEEARANATVPEVGAASTAAKPSGEGQSKAQSTAPPQKKLTLFGNEASVGQGDRANETSRQGGGREGEASKPASMESEKRNGEIGKDQSGNANETSKPAPTEENKSIRAENEMSPKPEETSQQNRKS